MKTKESGPKHARAANINDTSILPTTQRRSRAVLAMLNSGCLPNGGRETHYRLAALAENDPRTRLRLMSSALSWDREARRLRRAGVAR